MGLLSWLHLWWLPPISECQPVLVVGVTLPHYKPRLFPASLPLLSEFPADVFCMSQSVLPLCQILPSQSLCPDALLSCPHAKPNNPLNWILKNPVVSQKEETTAYACLHANASHTIIDMGFWSLRTHRIHTYQPLQSRTFLHGTHPATSHK